MIRFDWNENEATHVPSLDVALVCPELIERPRPRPVDKARAENHASRVRYVKTRC